MAANLKEVMRVHKSIQKIKQIEINHEEVVYPTLDTLIADTIMEESFMEAAYPTLDTLITETIMEETIMEETFIEPAPPKPGRKTAKPKPGRKTAPEDTKPTVIFRRSRRGVNKK